MKEIFIIGICYNIEQSLSLWETLLFMNFFYLRNLSCPFSKFELNVSLSATLQRSKFWTQGNTANSIFFIIYLFL